MSELATRTPQPPDRGLQLGVRRKPQLRLALGYRDEHRKGAPVKTDYFIPHGNDAAVAKFVKTYGETPRAIDIRLPGSLAAFLEIKHVAFAGGQNGEGGVLKAVGRENFTLTGVRGGPDVLTVFDVVEGKLSVRDVEIDGVDDPEAKRLGVYLGATVTFGIPDVLGLGGICQVGTRGKESIDTLWENAADIYGQLGPLATIVLRPKLILKESKMLTPTGSRAQVFVLDLYVPDSWDEIMARAREYRELLPARSQAGMLAMYGQPLEIEAFEDPPVPRGEPADTAPRVEAFAALPVDAAPGVTGGGQGQQAAGAQTPSPAPAAPDPWDDDPEPGGGAHDESAGLFVIPKVKDKGKMITKAGLTVAEAARDAQWFEWALKPERQWMRDGDALAMALTAYARALPGARAAA